MRRLTSTALLSLVALTLGGCNVLNSFLGGSGDEDTVSVPIPVPAQTADETFEQPLVPSALDAAAIASAELIQSTNPAERVEQFQKKQQDPYATLPIPPAPPAAPAATAPVPGGGTTPGGTTPGGTTPVGTTPGGTTPGGTLPGISPIQPLPELPKAETANAVAVTGIVRVGNETFAIVQAPDEPTSRYVRVGQRLSNGQVLVKRIETRGNQPVVVLEENGIEVALEVGSGGTAEAAPGNNGTPTATLPQSQPLTAVSTSQGSPLGVPQLPIITLSGPGG